MAYPSDITIGLDVYALQTQRATSSVRSDSTRPLDKPRTLFIGTETAKSGRKSSLVKFVSSEVIPCDATCNVTTPTTDNVEIQFKVVRNPSSGRATTQAEIDALLAQALAFLSDATNVTRLLNSES